MSEQVLVRDSDAAPPAKVSLREKHATETRERILEVAMALFAERGFDATTTDEIAEGADVSPRTFFRYFPSKEALLFHDLECHLGELNDLIAAHPDEAGPGETLVGVLSTMIGRLDATPEQRALMVALHEERRSLRHYQRSAIIESAEQDVAAALARRCGLAADDLGIRSVMAAVLGSFDLALRVWVEHGLERPFGEVFDQVVAHSARLFPRSI